MPFIPHTPDDIARMLEPEGEDHGLADLRGHSITYRIALGRQQGRKAFLLQSLPPSSASGALIGWRKHRVSRCTPGWRGGEDHRQHRESRGHRPNSGAPGAVPPRR
jgi:hypothetical protein